MHLCLGLLTCIDIFLSKQMAGSESELPVLIRKFVIFYASLNLHKFLTKTKNYIDKFSLSLFCCMYI